MKILVVEDDPVSLKLVTEILKKQNYETEATESADKAIEWLKKSETVDLIISDVMMPEIDGHKFLQLVRANSRFRETPVIFCTALGERSDVIRAVNLGITDYIVKPVDANILLSKVKKILGKNEQSSQPQRDKEAVEPVSSESPE